MKFTKEEKKDIVKKIFIIFSGIAFYFLLFNFSGISNLFFTLLGYSRPIIFGFVLAFVVNMITIQYEKIIKKIFVNVKSNQARTIAVIFGYLTLLLLVIFLITVVLPQFINSIINLAYSLPGLIQNTIFNLQENEWFKNLALTLEKFTNKIQIPNLMESLILWVRNQSGEWLSGAVYAVSSVFSGFFETFLAITLSVYIIFTKEKLSRNAKEILYSIVKEETSDRIIYFGKLLYTNFYNFFTGQFLEAIILGVIVFVGITIIGAPYALMLAVTTGVLNLIPYIGAVTGAIIGIILIMLNSFSHGLMFAIYIIIAQQIDGNVIYPRLVGSKMGLPPFWMMIAITLGGSTMGIVGMVIFVPIFSTIYTLVRDFSKEKLKQKNIKIEEK